MIRLASYNVEGQETITHRMILITRGHHEAAIAYRHEYNDWPQWIESNGELWHFAGACVNCDQPIFEGEDYYRNPQDGEIRHEEDCLAPAE